MGLITFDFDGTIADSLMIFVTAANRLATRFKYPPVLDDEVESLRNLSSREVLRRLPFPRWQLPFYLSRLRQEVRPLSSDLELFSGMAPVLEDLHRQGHTLGIVTSNSRATVRTFIADRNLEHVFTFIYGGQLLLGKERQLKKLRQQYQKPDYPVIFIGDETRDIEAAQQANIFSIAVSWGFNSRQILETQKPTRIVDHPQELLPVIEALSNFNED